MTQSDEYRSTCARPRHIDIGQGTRLLAALLLAGFLVQILANTWAMDYLAIHPARIAPYFYPLWTAALLPGTQPMRFIMQLLSTIVLFSMIEKDLTRRWFTLFWLIVTFAGSTAATALAMGIITTAYVPLSGAIGALWHLRRQSTWTLVFITLPARTVLGFFLGLSAILYILNRQWPGLAGMGAAFVVGYAFLRLSDWLAFSRQPLPPSSGKRHIELD